MTSKLRDLSPSHIQDQSRTLTSKILSLPSFVQSKNVSCYLSMPSGEIDTSMLVREILRSGKSLFVPRIDKTDDLDSLPAGVWGIKEPDLSYNDKPRANADEAGLDLILLPGLAFDRSSSRLGHGKGYYDRFITAYTQNDRPPPLLVGLALGEQLLNPNTIPTASHDWKMDCIVTDKEYIHRN
ncbi:5-formyltetrahydrofolate cyclo-ligase [Favolaschia claudopus]|uniref:5-formyltetrahydrofolate cyclo-ligase n=1 Tax=Favolaschia claudopus TaxID=2862362 RepID=A0AAV9ZV40_9AGAR